jgi:hypothetical protein
MIQPPPHKQHGLNQQYNNQSVFQSAPPRMNDNNQPQPLMGMMNSHSAGNNKMSSHHSQDMHGFYNQQQSNYGGNQFHNNGAGSSSSGMPNNFYQPYNNNMGHYSVSLMKIS